MRNAWRIFRDDIRLVTGSLAAAIALLALCLAPAIYAWFNIAANWDPYAGTAQLKVAIANGDEGYKSSLVPIELNIGDRVVGTLRNDEEYDWVSVDEGTALEGVRSGDYYAAVVIPGDFSSRMMSALSADGERVDIPCYLNMKESPDAASLAGMEGAGVVGGVRGRFADAVGETSLDLTSDLVNFANSGGSKDVGTRLAVSLGEAADNLESASGQVRAFASLADASSSVVAATSGVLAGSDEQAGGTANDSKAVSSVVSGSSSSGGDSSKSAEEEPGDAVAASVVELDDAVSEAASAASDIEKQVRDAGSSSGLGSVGADAARKLSSDVAALASSVDAISTRSKAVSEALQSAKEDIAGSADAAATSLGFAHDNLNIAANKLSAAASKVRKFQEDVSAGISKGNLNVVAAIVGSNASSIAQWLADPLRIEESIVYPVENYGSSVTPAYTVLAIWAGVVMLLILMKTEVERGRIRGYEAACERVLRPTELVFGRYLIFAAVSLLQATVMALGDLLFLRVQCVHPLLFFVACWACAIVFSAVAYALVVSFGGIGKALCALLAVVPAVSLVGQFPLQLMGGFFQVLAELAPFVHGMRLLQDALVGFVGARFAFDALCLAAFLVPSALLALALRRPVIRLKNAFDTKFDW